MHRYEVELDLTNANTSHTLMLDLIGGNKRVLDVGCASGYLAEALNQRGCVVSGVEADADLAELARPHMEKVVVADVEACNLVEAFGPGSFDVIVFGDVLEHLRDPLPVLRQARPLLAAGGTVVASVPNIAHGSIRLALLQGRFEYQPTGLLDHTHLRFFTLDTLEQLFRDAGLVAAEVRRTTTGPFDATHALDEQAFSPEIVDMVMADPESLTYQFVLRAVLDDAGEAVAALRAREEQQRRELIELRRALDHETRRRTEAETRAEELDKRADDLERQLHDALEDATATGAHLDTVLATRTMRWSSGARKVYGRIRKLR
jgi:2-polyprenyl-3-methyl-5-hydroxy-6-metoxy-1,4-benzoquinol methylase